MDRWTIVRPLAPGRCGEVSHTTRMRDVRMKKEKQCWQLQLNGRGNLLLENWALAKRSSLFEEVFKTWLEVLECIDL
jgi:hypothetical protein